MNNKDGRTFKSEEFKAQQRQIWHTDAEGSLAWYL
jgi:hypothetical protein